MATNPGLEGATPLALKNALRGRAKTRRENGTRLVVFGVTAMRTNSGVEIGPADKVK